MTEKLCSPDVMLIGENIARIRERIENACVRSGRRSEDVTLLAVTKTVPAERINTAIQLGIREIGENRVQELLQKQDALLPVTAHLIGHLQTNKVAQIAHRVSMVQSVDSLRVAEALDAAAAKHGITLDILAQVNIGGEESKFGVEPSEAADFCAALTSFRSLRLRGMMTIPPISDTTCKKREYFSRMSQLFIDIRAKNIDNSSMEILSMGMSDDFEEAILEGSTMVRIGSAIFGARQY